MGLNLWVELRSSEFQRSALLLTYVAVARSIIGRYCYNKLDDEVTAIRAVARFSGNALLLLFFQRRVFLERTAAK